ncbi:TATA element modulatory factor 1, partial [Mortierella alpina]
GGFGSSNYLYSRVKAQFSSQVGLISIPPRPELAVVRGAVCVGLNPRVVTSRIARRCYGISSDQPFEKGKDPLAKRKFEVNGVWCIDRFSPYVKRGQKLNVDESISREFSFTKYSEAPEDYNIALYAADTDGDPPRYTTDVGVSKLADIPIPCPHAPSSRLGSMVKVKVNMNFGLNEIKAEAVVGDKVYSTILQFDATVPAMSSFFGAPGTTGSATGAKGSPSNNSATSAGGWGSFLKQGLSTIESKLDMVLDMQVPIPGGSSGTLTSLSPHATVLPSSLSGSSSPSNTQPKRMAPPHVPGASGAAAAAADVAAAAAARASTDSRGEESDKRTSSSVTRSSVRGKDDDLVTVDPIMGMITTGPGIKRMSTPPTSAGSSAAAAAAAANRERLEQRMRGIFKKPAESAAASTSASTSTSPSPSVTASPSSSTRPSAVLEREDKPQDPSAFNAKEGKEKKEKKEEEKEDVKEGEKDDKDEDREEDREQEKEKVGEKDKVMVKESLVPDLSNNAQEEQEELEEQQEQAKTAEEPVSKQSRSAATEDGAILKSTASSEHEHSVVSAKEPSPEPETAAPSDQTIQSTDEDHGQVDTSDAQTSKEDDGAGMSKTNSGDDDDLPRVEEEPTAPAALDQEDSTGASEKKPDPTEPTTEKVELAKSLISDDIPSRASPITPSTDQSYTRTSSEQTTTKESAPVAAAAAAEIASTALEVENKPIRTGSGVSHEAATLDDNPLKRVVEQREEQLFKVMQEQSSLLERLRDLEDAKAAEDALQVVKIAGLEKIIETQKKELEVARGGNLASQPKSIQKTLEEQRGLLEEKDEQIRGLLAEGEILSKKEFKHLTTIKTLRMKNIEAEKIQMDTQKKLDKATTAHADAQAMVAKLTEENKQLNDTIRSLHDTTQRQSKQQVQMESELAQLREEKSSLKMGLDRAWQELADARKASAELSSQTQAAALEQEMRMNEELQAELDTFKAQHAAVESTLRQEIQELRVSLSNREEDAGRKEDELWMEIRSLQQRLEQNDNDSYELQEALDEARRPLLRQIEVLQNQHSTANRHWDKIEKSLTRRVTEAEEDVAKAQDRERTARDKLDEMKSQKMALEARLETLRKADTQLRSDVGASKRSLAEKEEEARKAQAELSKERISRERAIEEAREDAERRCRQQQLAEVEKLKQQLQQLQQQRPADDSLVANPTDALLSVGAGMSAVRRLSSSSGTSASSPMLAGGSITMGSAKTGAAIGNNINNNNVRTSFDSMTSPTSLDGMAPTLSRSSSSHTMAGISGSASSLGLMGLGSGSTGPAVAMERLNAMVRQLDGQVTFLSEQVRSANRNKDELSDELVRVTVELEDLQKAASRVPGLEQELVLLRERHRAALEMLGERTEEVQELKADLSDVKEAYRDQINDLLAQLEKLRRTNAQ